MKPILFKGHNVVIAKDQPQYQPLPVCYQGGKSGSMTSCWGLSIWERLKVLFTGRIYWTQLTFNNALQPQLPSTKWKEPTCTTCGYLAGLHKGPEFKCPKKEAEPVDGAFVKDLDGTPN